MKLTSYLKAMFAVGAFVVFSSFGSDAVAQPSSNQVDCARQLSLCKRNCDQLKAQAQRELNACEAQCMATYRSCIANASTNTARQACRTALASCRANCRQTFAAAMEQVNTCYQNCRNAYLSCLQGGYDSEG